jgi:hypothetical protein
VSAWDHLPAPVRRAVPELDAGARDGEPRADCSRCVMVHDAGPWSFHADTKCCTVHPRHANWLIGRSLRRSGVARDVVIARLATRDGVTALGIDAPDALAARYRATIDVAFGRDVTLRCPYYVGGEHACGVWHDRSSTCRTWFCRYDGGLGGAVAWSRAGALIDVLELRVARWCAATGVAPDPGADDAAWIAWFEACAERVDTIDDATALAIASDLLPVRAELVQIRTDVRPRAAALPGVLVPNISEVARDGDDVWIAGYSTFDAVRAPATIFELLSRLDGRPWRDALAAVPDPAGLDEALVASLHRVGALRDPGGADDLPFTVEMVGMDRWTRASR